MSIDYQIMQVCYIVKNYFTVKTLWKNFRCTKSHSNSLAQKPRMRLDTLYQNNPTTTVDIKIVIHSYNLLKCKSLLEI